MTDGNALRDTHRSGETTPALRFVPYQRRSIRCATVPPVTATVITRNEADAIGDALKSLSWADEIIVVDAESSDRTVAIASAIYRSRVRARLERLHRSEEPCAPPWRHTTGFFRSTPTSASRRCSARRFASCSRSAPSHAGVSHAACVLLSRPMGSDHRHVSRTISFACMTAGARGGTALHVHESVTRERGTVGYLKSELQHYPYNDLSRTSHSDGSLHDARCPSDVEKGRRADAARAAGPSADCLRAETTSSKAGFVTVRPA